MTKITAHITDNHGVFLYSKQVDPMGPQPAGAVYGELPAAQAGHTRMWRGEWVQVLDAEVPTVAAPTTISADVLRLALTAEYERRMQAIAAGYPPSERESWPVQTSEAYSLLADPQASTPWIDAAASARGLDRLELAQRIVAKDAQYRVFSGTLSGVRQRIEDQIDAAGDDQSALKAIDVTQGWPE